jgi:hypothetical protein
VVGPLIDKRLTFIPHVNYAMGKGEMVTGQLSPLTSRRNKMSIKNKLVLYKTVVLPTMTYASTAWGHVSDTQLHKQQVVQNKFLRRGFNAPWFVRNE